MRLLDREYAVAYKKTVPDDRLKKESQFHVIKNNFLSWSADPFPIEVNEELYIFAEIYLYTKTKGTIGYSKLTDKGFTKWKVVIEEPYHLSFPNLFWKDGILYMCPESHQDNTLHLYKCIDFPDHWAEDKKIAIGDFNDTIFYEEDNQKFLMTYALNDSFHIYKMENNQLIDKDVSGCVSDISTSRPAGKILINSDGKKNIITQIGKPAYGSGLVFKEFKLCWPDYEERELFRLKASDLKIDKRKNYIGLHTFNVSANYTVVDLIWEDILWQRIFFRIISRFRKIFKGRD